MNEREDPGKVEHLRRTLESVVASAVAVAESAVAKLEAKLLPSACFL